MSGCADPCRAVDVQAEVAHAGDGGLAGVQADPHAHHAPDMAPLYLDCGTDSCGCAGESGEDLLAALVDDLTAVRGTASRTIARCSLQLLGIRRPPSRSSSTVEPSTSLKRNVTVPVGSPTMTRHRIAAFMRFTGPPRAVRGYPAELLLRRDGKRDDPVVKCAPHTGAGSGTRARSDDRGTRGRAARRSELGERASRGASAPQD